MRALRTFGLLLILLVAFQARVQAQGTEEAITVEGLVYLYYLEVDGKVQGVGIEADERDYLVAAGGEEERLREIVGATVRARGRVRELPDGDTAFEVQTFEVLVPAPE